MPRQLRFTLWHVVLLASSPTRVRKHTHTHPHTQTEWKAPTLQEPLQPRQRLNCFVSIVTWQHTADCSRNTHTNPEWRQRPTHTLSPTPLKGAHRYMDTGAHKREERYGGGRAGSEEKGKKEKWNWSRLKRKEWKADKQMQNREAEDVWVGLKHIYLKTFIPALPKDLSCLTYVHYSMPIVSTQNLSDHLSSSVQTK